MKGLVSLFEAMGFGIPVICSKYFSNAEVSGNAGILVDPYSEKEIAEKIDLLLSDKLFYRQQQKLSIKKASEYSWERNQQKKLLNYVNNYDKNISNC